MIGGCVSTVNVGSITFLYNSTKAVEFVTLLHRKDPPVSISSHRRNQVSNSMPLTASVDTCRIVPSCRTNRDPTPTLAHTPSRTNFRPQRYHNCQYVTQTPHLDPQYLLSQVPPTPLHQLDNTVTIHSSQLTHEYDPYESYRL